MTKPQVIIIGAGIGGLTTALMLHQAGIPVKVFESVRTIKPLGVGINLLPHSVRRLIDLGLETPLNASGIRTQELAYYTRRGALIWSEPRGLDAGYQVPQYSIHRGELQMLLYETVLERLGTENILLGHHFADFEQDEQGVTARFVDKKTDETLNSFSGDILIGADGIHSQLRSIFYPDEGEPNYAGLLLWRGVTVGKPFLTGRSMVMVGHNTLKAVVYPISQKHAENGEALINWVAERPIPQLPNKEDWNREGNPDDFVPYFKDWNFEWLNFPKLFADAEAVYEFPMIDRDPVAQWSYGRVTLLGDAAHPMRPNGSNGASQAILDAEAIRDALVKHADIIQALKEYESLRIQPTTKIVLDNRQTGPERVLQKAEDQCQGCTDVCTCVPHEELQEIAQAYKRLAGFDKRSVNA